MKGRSNELSCLAQACRSPSLRTVCFSCRRKGFLSRNYASAATAEAIAEEPSAPSHQPARQPNHVAPVARPYYRLQAGVVLSRPPQITRDLHPFESSYFFYQRRLDDRLALPFTRYFYFKKGTPADIEWKRKQKERITPARDIGKYDAYGEEAWNDELLLDAKESSADFQLNSLLDDAASPGVGGGPDAGVEVGAEQVAARRTEVEKPMPRVTEADKNGDVTSLNRALQRSLYLLVRDGEGMWQFPSADLLRKEAMHLAAERIIEETGGRNMNTWTVGRVPIGHFVRSELYPVKPEGSDKVELGDKVFFMKARVMAGQVNLEGNPLGWAEFRWLTKEEIQGLVPTKYWSMTQDMLADR